MIDCQVFVELAITNPNSKNHSSRQLPLNNTLCSRRNLFKVCLDVKLISLETARHFRMFFGTRAFEWKDALLLNHFINPHLPSCSLSGFDISSLDSQISLPESASRRFM